MAITSIDPTETTVLELNDARFGVVESSRQHSSCSSIDFCRIAPGLGEELVAGSRPSTMLGERVAGNGEAALLRRSGGGSQIFDGETTPREDLVTRRATTPAASSAKRARWAMRAIRPQGTRPAANQPQSGGCPGCTVWRRPPRIPRLGGSRSGRAPCSAGTVVGPLQTPLSRRLAGVLAEAPPWLPQGRQPRDLPTRGGAVATDIATTARGTAKPSTISPEPANGS